MLAQSSGDWSVFKQIFADHWDAFQHAQPRYQTSYYDGLVAKMLNCGNPEQIGYLENRCLHCGQGTRSTTPIYICSPPAAAWMGQENAGSISSICPMRSCAAGGSGIC